jgi:hypothetical protein
MLRDRTRQCLSSCKWAHQAQSKLKHFKCIRLNETERVVLSGSPSHWVMNCVFNLPNKNLSTTSFDLCLLWVFVTVSGQVLFDPETDYNTHFEPEERKVFCAHIFPEVFLFPKFRFLSNLTFLTMPRNEFITKKYFKTIKYINRFILKYTENHLYKVTGKYERQMTSSRGSNVCTYFCS